MSWFELVKLKVITLRMAYLCCCCAVQKPNVTCHFTQQAVWVSFRRLM